MADATLDARLPPAEFQEQARRIRDGHCGLLPEAQVVPMTRVQIARDRAMADTVAGARQPGRTVLLVAGDNHVHRALGVPAHLPPQVALKVMVALAAESVDEDRRAEADADLIWLTPPLPPRDYCAELKGR